ncbi:unnamed protein product [Brassica oleracea]
MASSSSVKRFHVFPSFHGPDVRRGFLSHLHNHFDSKGITTFKDQEIDKGHSIGPELIKAIRESRVSVVPLSQNYASSGWCLDELVEILKCKETSGQIVMTIFYEVDPSSVRKQKGDFGSAFFKTWILMGCVGLEAHLTEVKSLLCLECDDVKMIGIWGPAGIGKTTIARALFDQLSSIGVDDYDSKLGLQSQFLSRILDRKDMRVHHLGAIKEWLRDQRVLIILDDVDYLEKLEVLAKEPSWFGSGGRIIVTTEDKQILKAHWTNVIYHVDFPSREEALENSVRDGFEELANKVVGFCSNLPLGLAVVGSSLRGQSKNEWELQLSKIETGLDRKIVEEGSSSVSPHCMLLLLG